MEGKLLPSPSQGVSANCRKNSGNGGATFVLPTNKAFADDGLSILFKTNVTTNTTQTKHTPSITPTASSTSSTTNHTVLLAVLIPVLLVLLAAAIAFWFWRRNRRPSPAELPPTGVAVSADRKYYGELSSPDAGVYGQKLDAERSELEANFPPAAELPTGKVDSTNPAAETAIEAQQVV